MSPSAPFTIIKTHTRALLPRTAALSSMLPRLLTRGSASPRLARFEYSVNEGGALSNHHKTDIPPARRHVLFCVNPLPAHKSVSLKFSADSWYQGPFVAQDFAIWAGGQPLRRRFRHATSLPRASTNEDAGSADQDAGSAAAQTPVPPTKTPVPPTQPASWTSSATVAKGNAGSRCHSEHERQRHR